MKDEKQKHKQIRKILCMDVCYYNCVAGWKEPCPTGSQGGIGNEGKWLLPVALLPKQSIDDRAQFKADGVIHTLKTAWGNTCKTTCLNATEDLFLGVRQKKPSLGQRRELSLGPGKQGKCFTEAGLL